MSSIQEFYSRELPTDYYEGLLADLSKLNEELHAFNALNMSLRSGYPFSAKDNICAMGLECTASSKVLKGYVPPFNATAVERMLGNGFGLLGKTNMDEFGFGTFGINSDPIARNPFNSDYVAGGSSSGAAIATALLKYHVAIAESTGGSISAPAAFCGVVGFTPTYGMISRYGLIDYANSLDKIGVMARTATDIRQAFDTVRGRDRYDTTCTDAQPRGGAAKRVLVIDQLMKHVDDRVRSAFDRLLGKLENLGYAVEHVSLEGIDVAVQAYYVISMAECSTNLAKFTGFKYGYQLREFSKGYNEFFTEARDAFGQEAKRRIILGTFVRSASVRSRYYSRALRIRAMLTHRLSELMARGLILSPTMPIVTPKISDVESLGPVQAYAMDILTVPANLCGFPHASFPYDYADGMPLGAQIVGTHFDDYSVIDFVSAWENIFDYRFKYNVGAL